MAVEGTDWIGTERFRDEHANFLQALREAKRMPDVQER
jgi:hypothetical protein